MSAVATERSHPRPAPPSAGGATLPSPEILIAQARHENFPVALWILGPRLRRHLMAVYGFARLVDDVGDEVNGDRLALLDVLQRELDQPEHPLMRELAHTVRACGLRREPLAALIEANRRDQVVQRYDSFAALLEYCQLSAAPVGQLVLGVFGVCTPQRVALSDQVCNALQVIEHLQDVDEDRARGRVYIGDFDAVAEAGRLLTAGPPLVRSLRGRARLAVAGFLAGGRVALEELRSGRRPRFAPAYLRAVLGR
ncbi:MAG: squalene/phytoene synthase family protein [Solirubrobacteraceae bacterium]